MLLPSPFAEMLVDPATQSLVDGINKLVNHLHSEIALLRQTQNQHASFIHRLPDEVLSMVFIYTIPINHFNSLNTKRESPSPRKARSDASSLGTICRQWRRVSISTPHIWRRISIAVQYTLRTGRYELDTQEAALAALRTHLARSGDVPLDVDVHFDGGKSFSRVVVAYPGTVPRGGLAAVVLEPDVMQRIGRLGVRMDRDWEYGLGVVKDAMERGCSYRHGAGRLKCLRLEFQACEGQVDTPNSSLYKALNAVVSIQTVNDLELKFRTGSYRITAPCFIPPLPTDGPAFDFHLPPAMTTHAELYNSSLEKVTTLLSSSSPSLTSLHLDMRDVHPYLSTSPPSDTHLSRLRQLNIILPKSRIGRERSHIVLRKILGGITTCPSLTSLAISSSDPCSSEEDIHAEEIGGIVIDFLIRSGASESLTVLSLEKIPLISSDVVTILQKALHLTDLDVVEVTPPQTSTAESDRRDRPLGLFGVEALASMIGLGQPGYLARLRRLHLQIWKDQGNWMEWFGDMVESRSSGLESVSLVVSSPSCMDKQCRALERLRGVQRRGDAVVRVVFGISESAEQVVGYNEPI